MKIDPEMLMAYADGELGPIDAKRVERAIAADPALAAEVERHRALRDRIASSFAPLAAAPVPERLSSLLNTNVVALPRPARPVLTRWRAPAALAACLALGVLIGFGIPRDGEVTARADGLYASGSLATGLDRQTSGAAGPVRILVSFRDRQGAYCRVFSAASTGGIACRDADRWALRRTQRESAATGNGGAYAQAGSADPDLMAAAQDMMAGEPLDAAGEQAARANGWR